MDAPSKTSSSPLMRARGLFHLTRLHKFPLGSLLVFWPYGWAVAMAAGKTQAPMYFVAKNAAILLVVASLLHSAFCVWNDICDQDLDERVERTRNRPLVIGLVKLWEAVVLFVTLLALTFIVVSYTNKAALFLTLSSLPINFAYPFAKRWTWWPQVLLGTACSWGCAVGWTSIVGDTFRLSEHPALQALIVGHILFMIYADTIYASQDIRDDEKAGIKSTARLFGSRVRSINALFGFGFISFLILAGILNGNGLAYFVVGCAGVAIHIAYQLYTWQPEDVHSSAAVFQSNHNLGYILFCGIILDRWL